MMMSDTGLWYMEYDMLRNEHLTMYGIFKNCVDCCVLIKSKTLEFMSQWVAAFALEISMVTT